MVYRVTLPPPIVGEWVPMTFEEFLDWSPAEGQAEWVDGKGTVYVGNLPRHGRLLQFLSLLIGTFLKTHDLGELLTSNVVLRFPMRPSGRQPDLMVILNENRHRIGERWVNAPADLIVELISDESVDRDQIEKFHEYESAGVKEYVLIDARVHGNAMSFYRLNTAGRYEEVESDIRGRYHSAVLPKFVFDPEWFRQDPLPKVRTVLAEIEDGPQ